MSKFQKTIFLYVSLLAIGGLLYYAKVEYKKAEMFPELTREENNEIEKILEKAGLTPSSPDSAE
ncbi:MAG: hypothetical protein NUV96_00845 [Candidatus Colwellbacteria bacterium]|nr:hypothetical protein [Candidatus Colwellbacteria bacterium]